MVKKATARVDLELTASTRPLRSLPSVVDMRLHALCSFTVVSQAVHMVMGRHVDRGDCTSLVFRVT